MLSNWKSFMNRNDSGYSNFDNFVLFTILIEEFIDIKYWNKLQNQDEVKLIMK